MSLPEREFDDMEKYYLRQMIHEYQQPLEDRSTGIARKRVHYRMECPNVKYVRILNKNDAGGVSSRASSHGLPRTTTVSGALHSSSLHTVHEHGPSSC